MCNNILNILKFIIKFNKYIIIVIDLKHFQNFPHCGVHLKRWKKKVYQMRKKNEHILASKWINKNITELICILTILFPVLLLKFIHPSIINQSLVNSLTAWLLYGRVLFWSFILPIGNFFFQQKVKNFFCSRFLKFLVRTNFCNLLFKQQNINKEQNLTF